MGAEMKLRQRSQQVFEAIKQGGKRSIRKIAEATGIAKVVCIGTSKRLSGVISMLSQNSGKRQPGAMAEAAGARNNLHLWHQVWHRGGDDVRVFLSVAIANAGRGFP
jgi:hypothetical protein